MPPLPSVATNAARAAITSARCCLYHSFSSEPPLPLFTSSECPPSLLIPRATFYPPIPKPFHDDPNTPPPPLTSLSSVRVSPRATRPAATTHDLLILLSATGLPSPPSHNTNMQNILHPHAHTHSRTHTHNVVRNKQEKGQQCILSEVHNSILTFSEAWVHSTKIKPHLFSTVRPDVYLALTWNISEPIPVLNTNLSHLDTIITVTIRG